MKWVLWDGVNECPVKTDSIISIKYRNGRVVRGLINPSWLDWSHNGSIDDIVEYMLE